MAKQNEKRKVLHHVDVKALFKDGAERTITFLQLNDGTYLVLCSGKPDLLIHRRTRGSWGAYIRYTNTGITSQCLFERTPKAAYEAAVSKFWDQEAG